MELRDDDDVLPTEPGPRRPEGKHSRRLRQHVDHEKYLTKAIGDVTMTFYASVSLRDKREALKKLAVELS